MKAFFKRVGVAEHREQVQQNLIAAQLIEHPPPSAPGSPPPARLVGRSKKKRDAVEALESAAAADALVLPDSKRDKYTKWFDSPYINDVLKAYVQCGNSARRTVAELQKAAPDQRYTRRLSHSTIASWYEKDGRALKKQHQIELADERATVMGHGRSPALMGAEGAEQRIIDTLLQMRQAGVPLNSRIVRWVMLAALQHKHPDVLAKLELRQA